MEKHKCGSIPARSLIRAASAAMHRDRELHTDTFVHARRHGHTRTHTPGTNAQRSRPARLLSPARPFSSPRFAGHSLRAPSRAPPWPRGLAAVCPPQGRLWAVRTPGFLMNEHSPHVGPTPARATGTQCWILPLSLPWSGFPFLYNVWLSQRKAEVSWLGPPIQPPREAAILCTGWESAGCKDAAPSKPCLPSSRPGARDGGRRCRSGLRCPLGLPQLPPSPPGPNPGAGWQHRTAAGSETTGRSGGGCLHTPLLQDAVGERLCFQQQQIDKTPLHEPNRKPVCGRLVCLQDPTQT